MSQCFKEQPCDTQRLNHNTVPVAECEGREVELYGTRSYVTEVPILTCACLWRHYQRSAEEIVAPGGVLIADPVARNRAINAAYARLWLHDSRFQWAGLAAFASKQVGCGLLHAADSIDLIRDEHEARQPLREHRRAHGLLTPGKMAEQAELWRDYQAADARNPALPFDYRSQGQDLSLVQRQYRHVYDMMALGNTTLFLDVFPLHEFYAKRGWAEFEECLGARSRIFGDSRFPILWPVGQKSLQFGVDHREILQGFAAIESGDVALSVQYLALHEQKNILQPTIYQDTQLRFLLRANHLSYVTGIPSGAAQAIELTLTSQCQRLDDGRTIGIGNNPLADLSDLEQRMAFVFRAAARFDEMLSDSNRTALERSIQEIALSGSTP